MYFFESTTYDTVFIEDLDRFNQPNIFIKLRELNTVINNYDNIKRKVVFIYAIKDDMFKDEERTKFFDFIVRKVYQTTFYYVAERFRAVFCKI